VFERFTERARQVVVFAQDDARSLTHNYIGTEHLLLGLLRSEEGFAARLLATFGVTPLDGHNYIGTEHVLLALGRESDGVGARILQDFGAGPETVRSETMRRLTAQGAGPRAANACATFRSHARLADTRYFPRRGVSGVRHRPARRVADLGLT
jgi:ATP-dependent Clp protease ATP-binding subunit ClpC